jgi:hypothetical protein
MTQAPYDNQILRRYLLGTASEDETARLDELSLADDECALALAAVENDLVDAYASANLPAGEREQFERHYLASPLRREKVQFAEELQRFGKRAAAPQMVQQTEKSSFINFAWFKLTPLWQAGFATAALVLLATCAWLVVENRRLQQAVNHERAALTLREAELQARQLAATKHESELAKLREQLAQTVPSPLPRATLPTAPALNLITFTLAAPLRGASSLPKLEIPASATQVSVRLELESRAYARYRVVLRDPLTQRLVWQSGSLSAAQGKTGASLTVRLPAKLFATQRYAFELSGLTADNVEERLSSYPLEVRQP